MYIVNLSKNKIINSFKEEPYNKEESYIILTTPCQLTSIKKILGIEVLPCPVGVLTDKNRLIFSQ